MNSNTSTIEAVLLPGIAATQAMAMREGKTAGQALLFLAGYLDTNMPQVARALVDLAQAVGEHRVDVQHSIKIGTDNSTAVKAALETLRGGGRP